MKCNMDLNITSGDKTLSITVVYRLTSYGTGVGCVNAIIGNDNPGWDQFICMNKHFIVIVKTLLSATQKKNLHHIMVAII